MQLGYTFKTLTSTFIEYVLCGKKNFSLYNQDGKR